MSDFLQLHRKHFSFKKFVRNVIEEDLGDGDHTSLSTIPSSKKGKMQLLVKERGIIAGVDAAEKIIRAIDHKIKFRRWIEDGKEVAPGEIVFLLEGKVQNMLLAERLVLNVMQRMSAIATKTHHLQFLCGGTKARVLDTRKTTPGFRFFEKWAVLIGGGGNHRYGLSDMILIKDNHIDFAGGITNAIDAVSRYQKKKKLKLKVEIETRNLADVKAVLRHGGVHRIMLDNYTPKQTQEAVKLIAGRVEVESSGGITEQNIAEYARAGVDFISIGAITHHVKALDLSLKAVADT